MLSAFFSIHKPSILHFWLSNPTLHVAYCLFYLTLNKLLHGLLPNWTTLLFILLKKKGGGVVEGGWPTNQNQCWYRIRSPPPSSINADSSTTALFVCMTTFLPTSTDTTDYFHLWENHFTHGFLKHQKVNTFVTLYYDTFIIANTRAQP